MLMGDIDTTATATWIGVAALGITTFGTTVGGLWALLRFAIEKKYDARFQAIEAESHDLKVENASLRTLLDTCKSQHDESEKDRKELREMVDALTTALLKLGVKIEPPAVS